MSLQTSGASVIYNVPIFLLFNSERVQRAALRNLVQIRRLGHRGGADRAELVAQVEARGDRQSDPAADATPHRDVLMAADLVGDRVTDDSGTQTTLPQDLAGLAINGAEIAQQIAVEGQTAVGDQCATPVRIGIRDFPHRLTSQYV